MPGTTRCTPSRLQAAAGGHPQRGLVVGVDAGLDALQAEAAVLGRGQRPVHDDPYRPGREAAAPVAGVQDPAQAAGDVGPRGSPRSSPRGRPSCSTAYAGTPGGERGSADAGSEAQPARDRSSCPASATSTSSSCHGRRVTVPSVSVADRLTGSRTSFAHARLRNHTVASGGSVTGVGRLTVLVAGHRQHRAEVADAGAGVGLGVGVEDLVPVPAEGSPSRKSPWGTAAKLATHTRSGSPPVGGPRRTKENTLRPASLASIQ